MRKLKVLVVEDDPMSRKLMAAQLREHDVDFAPDLAAAGSVPAATISASST